MLIINNVPSKCSYRISCSLHCLCAENFVLTDRYHISSTTTPVAVLHLYTFVWNSPSRVGDSIREFDRTPLVTWPRWRSSSLLRVDLCRLLAMTDLVPRSEATTNPDTGTAQTSNMTAAIRGPCVNILHRFMTGSDFEKEQKAWLRTGQNKASKTAPGPASTWYSSKFNNPTPTPCTNTPQ